MEKSLKSDTPAREVIRRAKALLWAKACFLSKGLIF